MNLVCMLIPLLLYGAVFVRFTTLTVTLPDIPRGDPPEDRKELGLTVFATARGFHIRVNPIHRLPWMSQADGAAIGPDIPKKDGGWDYEALADRLEDIKRDHGNKRGIVLGAEGDVSLDVLIRMMDVCRGAPQRPLFPDVTLTTRKV